MKTFEIFSESKKKGQNGRRKFKTILCEIHPDDCVDVENQVGTQYNKNGITWIKKYCEKALSSINGMSLRCEFLDDDRTKLNGHGMTGVEDGIPIFENAVVIGTFTKGYIDEIETPEGEKITACIGEGEIDSSCYNNLCQALDADIEFGIYPDGSVEIMRTENNTGIIYKYGYKEYGRIPTEFIFSGYALLGVAPSDDTAQLIELNNKEEKPVMNNTEITALIEQTITSYTNQINEINECKSDCKKKIDELNNEVEQITNEKNEVLADSEKIKAALEACQKERDEAWKKLDDLYVEMEVLKDELGKAKAKERIGELNEAIAQYNDEEKSYAKEEIEAFNADPVASEINSVIDKILIGIGKKAKELEASNVVVEHNSATNKLEDIFSAVEDNNQGAENDNIF